MTQGMTQTKAHSSFDMPALRRRAKKLLRRKYKKTIKLSDLDKIWKEYCRYAITNPLIQNGEVNIDQYTKLEIVGRRIIDDPKALGLMSRGVIVKNGGYKKPVGTLNPMRNDFVYKIRLTDPTFKGGWLIYEPDRTLSKKVHKALMETNKYYRIEK
jgi:hypothetical protein